MYRLPFLKSVLIAVVLGSAVWGIPSAYAQSEELGLGSAMPLASQSWPSVSGGQATLASLGGERGTVVVFWSNDCPWVSKYEQRLLTLAGTYATQGFGFVLVNSNDPQAYPEESLSASQQRARDGGYAVTYLMDSGSELARAFGATRTPHVYVFDASDRLVYVGTIDDSPGDPGNVQAVYLEDALDAVLAGMDVPMPRTKAFGCTIKFRSGN